VVKVLEVFLGHFRGGLAKGTLKPEQRKKINVASTSEKQGNS
jgi:hypothetical protein